MACSLDDALLLNVDYSTSPSLAGEAVIPDKRKRIHTGIANCTNSVSYTLKRSEETCELVSTHLLLTGVLEESTGLVTRQNASLRRGFGVSAEISAGGNLIHEATPRQGGRYFNDRPRSEGQTAVRKAGVS